MISNLFLAKLICFCLAAGSFVLAAATYRIEKKRTGGLGLASFLIVAIIVYCIVNPLAYLINPEFAVKYWEYLGDISAKQVLPGLLATFIFMLSFTIVIFKFLQKNKPLTGEVQPINHAVSKKIIIIASILFFLGIILFFLRNIMYFGSLFGSFNAIYSGGNARPQAGTVSNYLSLLNWALIIYSIVIFWQVRAKRWNKLLALLPIIIGAVFAIAEGNRVLIGTTVLVWLGWHLLRSRLTIKLMIFGLILLTGMTLLANPRYKRGEESAVSRSTLIFSKEYFRPFWAGDPTGPSVVLTAEAQRTGNINNVSWGMDYFQSLKAMVPSFIWSDRPRNPTDVFSERFSTENKEMKYVPGTGFAYSMIAESMTNLWYFGPIFLGVIWGLIVIKIISWYSTQNEAINRAICALSMYFVVWFVPRDFIAVYLNPITLIGIVLAWFVLHKIDPKNISRPFS